jgi:Uma2 family endonuclease
MSTAYQYAEQDTEDSATYADCLAWDESFRAQIIDGEVIEMPSPTIKHQTVSMELCGQLFNFLKKNPIGKLLAAPVDLRLFPRSDLQDTNVFVPDIVVVCDPAILDGRSINGAPDLVIEILSPSTAKYDRGYKFNQYQAAGVKEYWIVSPEEETVIVYTLEDGRYTAAAYKPGDKIALSALPGCEIDLGPVFT